MQALRKNKRKIFAAAAAALILILSVVPAFADQVSSVNIVLDVPPFTYVNGVLYDNEYSISLGTVSAGDIITFSDYDVKYGNNTKYVSYYVFGIEYQNTSGGGNILQIRRRIVYNQAIMITQEDIDAFNNQANAVGFYIQPVFVDSAGGQLDDDEYHSSAFVKVINALWQNFYTTFLSLTSQINIFGISLITIIALLVLVLVVVLIIRVIRGH